MEAHHEEADEVAHSDHKAVAVGIAVEEAVEDRTAVVVVADMLEARSLGGSSEVAKRQVEEHVAWVVVADELGEEGHDVEDRAVHADCSAIEGHHNRLAQEDLADLGEELVGLCREPVADH